MTYHIKLNVQLTLIEYQHSWLYSSIPVMYLSLSTYQILSQFTPEEGVINIIIFILDILSTNRFKSG